MLAAKVRLLVISCIALLMLGCATTPYRSRFQCPATYPGQCETIQQAYEDSLHDIDPKLFDPRWIKKEKEWEKRHAELIKARKRAGESVETVDEKLKKFKEKLNHSHLNETSYRKKLFDELKRLLAEPEKPVVVPPKVVRVLVLSTLAKEPDGREIYVSPRYIYFMLDQPHWLLHKVPEKVPFDSRNPLIRREK